MPTPTTIRRHEGSEIIEAVAYSREALRAVQARAHRANDGRSAASGYLHGRQGVEVLDEHGVEIEEMWGSP
jgi:hypothetical protein